MNKESSIGIFDSGIGGVTVLKEIIKILPNENYIYYSDSKNNPYGDKENSEIISICDNIVNELEKKNCKARVAYLNGSENIETPPVELIQFVDSKIHKEQSDLFTTSISEVCFYTDDIDSVYKTLIENHVECLSEPQYFDFRADGFGESRAFYFRDPDGIILEMMQPL